MHISKIQRTYSRSVNVKKPDGTEVWIKHEATIEATIPEDDQMDVHDAIGELAKIVVFEVAESIKTEKAKILASVQKPLTQGLPDEPFATKDSFKNLPKL